jgi:hypothetical protein
MENTSTQNSATDYLKQKSKEEARLITIIAVVVMIGFVSLLAYMFFGH